MADAQTLPLRAGDRRLPRLSNEVTAAATRIEVEVYDDAMLWPPAPTPEEQASADRSDKAEALIAKDLNRLGNEVCAFSALLVIIGIIAAFQTWVMPS